MEVAERYIHALANRDWPEACSLLSDEAKSQLLALDGARAQLYRTEGRELTCEREMQLYAGSTDFSKLAKARAHLDSLAGDTATVHWTLGSASSGAGEVVRVGNRWLIGTTGHEAPQTQVVEAHAAKSRAELEVFAACQEANGELSALETKLAPTAEGVSTAAIEETARSAERVDEAMLARIERLPSGVWTQPLRVQFTEHQAELQTVITSVRRQTSPPGLWRTLLRSLLIVGGGCGRPQSLAPYERYARPGPLR